jgi:tetratricopeptide (TPR) repeat protein
MGRNIFKDSHVIAFVVFIILLVATFVYLKNFTSKDYLVEKHSVKAQAMLQKMDLLIATDEEVAEVIAKFEEAISMSPLSGRSGKLHFNIARIYVVRKDYERAIEEMEKVIRNFSRNVKLASEAQFQIGRIHELRNDWEAAVEAYEKVYDQHGLSQRGLYSPLYIAERYKMMGESEKSEEAYQKALRQYEKLINELGDITQAAIVVNYLALTYGSQGSWNIAAEKWEYILETYEESPLIPTTLMMLGEVYADRLDEKQKAIEKYNTVVTEYPDSDLAKQAGLKLLQLYFFTEEYEKAREWCLKIIEEQENNPQVASEARLLMARTHQKEGNWEEAEKGYDLVVEQYSGSAAALRVPIIKAKHYQDNERMDLADRIYDSALTQYREIIAEDPSSEIALNVQDLISLVYVNREDWNGLISHIDEVLKQVKGTPRHAQLLFLKGYITQSKLDDLESARFIYEDFLKQYPGDHPLATAVENQMTMIDEEESIAEAIAEEDDTAGSAKEEDEMIESLLPAN